MVETLKFQGRLDDEPIQFLDQNGQRHTSQTHEFLEPYLSELTSEKLRESYQDMRVMREFDIASTALQRQGKLALYVPLRGQEAAQIGSQLAIGDKDMVFPSYREHAVAYKQGVDLRDILKLFVGTHHGGGWDPLAHNFHLYTLVIGSHTLHATGYAMGIQRDGLVANVDPEKNECVFVYFGDGSTSQGDVNEAFGFAAVNEAPVVFFCQNNQWAISVPVTKQTKVPIARRALGYGFPGIRVDGNDVLASYAVSRYASEHTKNGKGPVLIEAVTYRMGAHTTSDDPTRYRTSAEEEHWRQRDPIDRLEKYLRENNLWDQGLATESDEKAKDLAAGVREFVLNLPTPEFASGFNRVYATAHQQITRELADYRKNGY